MALGIFGLNIHGKMSYGQDYSAQQKLDLIQVTDDLNSAVHTVMDWPDMASTIKGRHPDCAVIHRQVHVVGGKEIDGNLWEVMTPERFYEIEAPMAEKGFVVQYMNEPSGYGDLGAIARHFAKVADLFGNKGWPIAGPSWGEGNPDVDRLDELDPMFEALEKWKHLHIYSVDEYGTHRGMLFVEDEHNSHGTNNRYNVYPWRVGRFEVFTLPYIINKFKFTPKVVVREYGIDDAHDGSPKRFWQDAGWSEDKYADEVEAPVRKIYKADHYLGVCIYPWGNTGRKGTSQDWDKANVSNAKQFQKRLIAFNRTFVRPGPPKPPDPPKPPVPPKPDPIVIEDDCLDSDTRWTKAEFSPVGGIVNIRSKRSTDGAPINTLSGKQTGWYISNKDWGDWVLVRLESKIRGWVYSPILVIKELERVGIVLDLTKGEAMIVREALITILSQLNGAIK